MLRNEHVGHPALTDPETGVANRLHFELVYSYLFDAGDRGVALTVMFFHVAGFEGPSIDGQRLREVSQRLQKVTRTSDLVAHLGAGQFAMLLVGSNRQGGLLAADRIQGSIEELAPGAISIGLAAYSTEMKAAGELLDAAERALQQAREAGGGIEILQT